MNHLPLSLRTKAASLYYCTHRLPDLMYAGISYADDAVVTWEGEKEEKVRGRLRETRWVFIDAAAMRSPGVNTIPQGEV